MIFKGAAKKRQKISTVETALFSIDVFCHLATFLVTLTRTEGWGLLPRTVMLSNLA